MKKETRDEIRKRYKRWRPRSDPYQYGDWMNLFTEIENNVWHDIRCNGLPFYPQFPVGPFFVDFADPRRKLAIEVDGKEYHSTKEQKIADAKREKELKKLGWQVFRIQGRQTYKDRDYFVSLCERMGCRKEETAEICREHWEEYETDCSEGIIIGIHRMYDYDFV